MSKGTEPVQGKPGILPQACQTALNSLGHPILSSWFYQRTKELINVAKTNRQATGPSETLRGNGTPEEHRCWCVCHSQIGHTMGAQGLCENGTGRGKIQNLLGDGRVVVPICTFTGLPNPDKAKPFLNWHIIVVCLVCCNYFKDY